MDTEDIKRQEVVEQEIDLVELGMYLWSKRAFLFKVCGISALVALVIAFSIPKEYTTAVKIAPESQGASRSSGNLGGLAALAGVNLNSQTGADAILPTLYPDVVQSTPFLLELFPVEVADKKDTYSGSLYDYMFDHQESAWWGYIVRAPFKLLGAIMSLFKEEELADGNINPFNLTSDQAGVLENLKERVSVAVDQKTFAVTLTVKMQDPLISARITDVVLENLKTYITDYRTQKAKQDFEFTEKVFADAKTAYYEAQQNYARFVDGNRNIATASFRTEQERLRDEMTLAFNVYNTLAQKLEQDKLKVQEQTPVYAVIEPATVPIRAASPKKMMILVGVVFLGLFGGVGWLFLKKHVLNTL